ncbi:hypothetical protein BDN72DRAFT_886694 [Pluteus cervinus]|uniref:Uncharacterized protein n=1 Tax=Pluteus cervinus TaxID=181527 RepID=A0ACD3B7Z6_9AGAR|nr:hypothetical protein BDN72DRAFT_886694 [Pluteus cervinus]
MFNAPRPAQRYTATNGLGLGGSYVEDNPLAGSTYDDGLDPWSAAPSPAHTPVPQVQQPQQQQLPSKGGFSSVIADATVPYIYLRAFAAVDPENTGETSVSALSRVLSTSALPASTIDKIVSLVSSRPRVSKLEFFVALALVALAQSGKDVSIEQVAALSQQNALPEPALDLDRLPPSYSTFAPNPINEQRKNGPQTYPDDPWNTATNSPTARMPGIPSVQGPDGPFGARGSIAPGQPSSLAGTGLQPDWWKRLENVKVTILGQQGFILNRYTVYEVTTDRGPPVPRRYSEFVVLWECLLKRYPFRLFPALPPKRLGPDEQFLEQRRRGLARALAFAVNHPILKEDGLLSAFLTEPSFDLWRKQASYSLDEESAFKRVDRIEEMTIPSDLEDKMATIRNRLNPLIDQWQRICILAERIIKRREAAAVRLPPAFKRAYLPTHFAFPLFSSFSSTAFPSSSAASFTSTTSSTAQITPSSLLAASAVWNANGNGSPDHAIANGVNGEHHHHHDHDNLAGSIYPGMESTSMWGSVANLGSFANLLGDEQGDMSRLTNTLRAVVEVNERCWRGDECELSNGVRGGLQQMAAHALRYSEISEMRTKQLFDVTLEPLKSQRDLYLATRDLFIRHDRLSIDQVDRLKKRVESNSAKLDGVRTVQKEGWAEEADKLALLIEKDQASIAAQLNRRVFIRACMWHELRVVLHNRENTLLSGTVQNFAREEFEFTERVADTWSSLAEAVENMPYE